MSRFLFQIFLTLLFACPAARGAFEQDQRINALTLQFTTDTFATNNAFGGAFASTVQSQLQSSINSGISNGLSSVIFLMPGLADLTGTNAPSLQIGIVSGVPYLPANTATSYSGSADLDWWYFRKSSSVDPTGVALQQLSGSIMSKVLSAGPGRMTLDLTWGGANAPLAMWDSLIHATSGPPSALLQSTNNFPPGHRAGENLDPALQSFSTLNAGQLRGNITAASLATVPIPAAMLQNNDQGYTAANSMLDLLIGGSTTFGGLIRTVNPTQPDKFDPNAPVAGAGPPYRFAASPTTHAVTACRDRLNNVVALDAGLNGSAYSAYFKFTTDRVIALRPARDPVLTESAKLGTGAFRFAFTNLADAFFTVFTATNVSLPRSNWTVLGSPGQIAPGVFEFVDSGATNDSRRFYRVQFP